MIFAFDVAVAEAALAAVAPKAATDMTDAARNAFANCVFIIIPLIKSLCGSNGRNSVRHSLWALTLSQVAESLG
jgi:hypothetical protein